MVKATTTSDTCSNAVGSKGQFHRGHYRCRVRAAHTERTPCGGRPPKRATLWTVHLQL